LQHTFACSDEALIDTWVENPYRQYFCGQTYFQHKPPVDPSSLTRWRHRMGEEGVEWLLTTTLEAARKAQVVKARSFEKLGMRAMPGNPYDGHTLYETLEQAEILSGVKAKEVFVDRGYRGEQTRELDAKVWISGARRGVTRRLKADIKRRSAIEPIIGHMKNDGLLRRNWLKGRLGEPLQQDSSL
jgi:IS5 family transposase